MPRLSAVTTAPAATMSAFILTSRLMRLHSFFLLSNVRWAQLLGQSHLKSNINAWTSRCEGNKKMLIWSRRNLITYSQLIKASEA